MKRIRFLNSNTLKLIAATAMIFDHLGLIFFPYDEWYRIVGRLAFPLFAFFIAEGCKYTKHKFKYLGTMFIFGVIFQVIFYVATKIEYYNIFFTFTLSILMIYALESFQKKLYDEKYSGISAAFSGIIFMLLITLTYVLNQNYQIDYNFFGAMAPVFASLFIVRSESTPKLIRKLDNNFIHVLLFSLALYFEAIYYGWVQMFSLLTIPLLLLYSGKRGKLNLKNFFYLFYPLHLGFLFIVYFIIQLI